MRGLIRLAAALAALLPLQEAQSRDVIVWLVQQELGAEQAALTSTTSQLQQRLTSFSSRMQGFVPPGRPPFPVITIAPAQRSLEVTAAGAWPPGTLAMLWGPIDSGPQGYRSNIFIDIGRASAFSRRPNRFYPVQTLVPRRLGANSAAEVGVAAALIQYAILARMLEMEPAMVEPVARELDRTILDAKRESTGFLPCLQQIERGRDEIRSKLPEALRAQRQGRRISYSPSALNFFGQCQSQS